MNYDALIKTHYRKEAEKHKDSEFATMPDKIYRNKEIDMIQNFIFWVQENENRTDLKILDLGCGNGFTVGVLRKLFAEVDFYGFDFSEEFIEIAKERQLKKCTFKTMDARAIDFEGTFFDVIFTERTLINIMSWEEKQRALNEIWRLLKPGGFYLMLENFTDGLKAINKARSDFGLEPLKEAYHNSYLEKKDFFDYIDSKFRNVDPSVMNDPKREYVFYNNYMSSYFFVSRFLHNLLTKAVGAEFIRDSEFVKFFCDFPPKGNYAAPQAHFLERI
jgi:ubiquinone/menaquinone biosynthesis C-methylase UbiE